MTRDIRLDILRSVSIFAVILIHVVSIMDAQKNFETYYWSTWILSILNESLFWCVPVFFMLSGALLLAKSDEPMHTFYKKRITKILIPTLFWSAFFLIYLIIYKDFTLYNIIGAILKGKPFYHLWFMYAIIGLYIFTPFLRILIANLTQKQINIFLVLLFIFTIANNYIGNYFHNQGNIFSLFLSYIGYFILGYSIYKNKKNFIKHNKIYLIFFIIATIIFSIMSILIHKIPITAYYTPFIAFEAILLFIYIITSTNKIKFPKIWVQLSTLSFGAYLIHPLFILLIPNLQIKDLIYIPFLFLLIMIASYTAVYILKKIKYLKNIV